MPRKTIKVSKKTQQAEAEAYAKAKRERESRKDLT